MFWAEVLTCLLAADLSELQTCVKWCNCMAACKVLDYTKTLNGLKGGQDGHSQTKTATMHPIHKLVSGKQVNDFMQVGRTLHMTGPSL